MSARTDDFDFELPERLIASRPSPRRDDSRMLVVDRAGQRVEHRHFRDFPDYAGSAGDLTVLNDTRVVPARFWLAGESAELLCVDRLSPVEWICMVRPGKRFRMGKTFRLGESEGKVEEILEDGTRRVRFDEPVDVETMGELALPPYLGRRQEPEDLERYQTVFAREAGAIAAPTAGLHFTEEILASVSHAFVTLHVGPGTFLPVKVENVVEHSMHSEKFAVSDDAAASIERAGRVLAVGTTVVRVLEHFGRSGGVRAGAGETDIFIYPPFEFRVIDGLLTNFHLPKSTLLMLVSALAGRELILEAYREAVAEEYRFYSYGDCMLIL